MKNNRCIIAIFVFILLASPIFSQEKDMKKLKAEVEKEVIVFKKTLKNDEFTTKINEFRVDTFRIERMTEAMIDADGSTSGMVEAIDVAEKSYDALLNKYYKRIMDKLKGDDKKSLKEAQRAWLAFRDSERKLMGTLTMEQYSGGGTIQRIISAGRSLSLIKDRTAMLFGYWDEMFDME